VTHHAKATSAGSTEGSGSSRGLFRRAFATRGASGDAKGSGARSNGRLRATLAVLVLAIAAFALTAAPALAAPSATTPVISNVSYNSAHVTGKVSTANTLGNTCSFEYSTDGLSNWKSGLDCSFFGAATNKEVGGTISVPKGATEYYVRLHLSNFFEGEAFSPEPNPSFITLAVDPPTIPGTVEADPVFSTSATATAKVKRPANADPAFNVNCHFEYISDAQFLANEGNGDPGFTGAEPVPCTENPITKADLDAEPETKVTAPLTGLSPATAYHLRLVAENASPDVVTKDAATTFTTTAKVAAPTVIATDDATDVSYHTAKVSGEVQRPAGADPALDITSCRFEYVTDALFKENEEVNSQPGFTGAAVVSCDKEVIKADDPTPTEVNAELTGLKSGVKYHLRLAAENSGGTEIKEATNTFTTLPGGDPTFTLDPSPTAGYTTVELTGTVTRGLGEDKYIAAMFEIAEVGTEFPSGNGPFVETPYYAIIPHGSGSKNFSYKFTGLNPGTEYKFRMTVQISEESGGLAYPPTSPAPYPTATTRPLEAPTATLDPVTTFTGTTAHFSGTVDTHAPAGPLDALGKAAYKTDWQIECTPECPASGALSGTVSGEEGSKAISITTQLHANTFYEVQLTAHNELYTVETPIQTFQTPLIAPTVTATPGASDGQGGYFLEGLVNSNNTKVTSCKFEYGTTATYPNTYEAPCLPNPSGPNEVQLISVEASEGQFKLSFRGQTTGDLPFNATPAEVQTALRALSKIGSTGVNVSGTPQAYKVTFAGGGLAGANVEPMKGSNGTTPLGGGAGVGVSTETQGGTDHAVSVEAHLEALTVGSTYHFRIFVTGAGGAVSSVDRTFIPTLAEKETCSNAQLREENSSLALPECRAYEEVSPNGKEGFGAGFVTYAAGGDRVLYVTSAPNIAKSGASSSGFINSYVTNRTANGWETIPNLNGSSGSLRDAPSYVKNLLPIILKYSGDLRSSLWNFMRKGDPPGFEYFDLRTPDGLFASIGKSTFPEGFIPSIVGTSEDLSHLVIGGTNAYGGSTPLWGPGVFEYLGTGNEQPSRRVDVDNSGTPVSGSACGNSVSSDGRVIVFTATPCDGSNNAQAGQIWARVNGTTSIDVSASQCDRVAPACNAPAKATFVASALDGSRVFFTTNQQLVNGDTDQATDLYACDIPAGTPAPVGDANPCAALRQISAGADVESVGTTSANGATVLFTAKGVLADNEDALKEQAVAGDHNLYVWRQDSGQPEGQTSFVGRLGANDIGNAQSTPDGRYLVFTTASQLVETDTDNARDVYRYDADTGELIRVSTNVFGAGGNGDGLDAELSPVTTPYFERNSPTTISDDGQKILFATTEALSPADGNAELDLYLWTPARVSLITTGSVGGGLVRRALGLESLSSAIDSSGQNIYFQTAAALTPADSDDLPDVYVARVGGGFSFAHESVCTGEKCQPDPIPPSPNPPSPANTPNGEGNVKPLKPCPKGKIRKKNGKCVKMPSKKHHKKNGKGKKAGHNRGGSK
jgi:hypothetical protein